MGAAVIRSYGTTESTTKRIEGAIEGERARASERRALNALMFPSGELFAVVTVAAVVVIGVVMGPASGLTAGELVGFMLLVNRFLEPVAEVTEILDQTQTAVSGWRRVLDLLDTPIDVVEPVPGVLLPRPAVDRRRERLLLLPTPPRVRGDPRACPPRCLGHDRVGDERRCRRGHWIGEDHLRQAPHSPRRSDTRRILVAGLDPRDVNTASLRSSLVMVPQDAFLFDTTIAENVRFGRRSADRDAVRLAFVELGLEGWSTRSPKASTRESESVESTSPSASASSWHWPVPTWRTPVSDPRRGHLRGRRGDRSPIGASRGEPGARAHIGHDRAPTLDGRALRRRARLRPGPARRARRAPRPRARRRRVCPSPRELARCDGDGPDHQLAAQRHRALVAVDKDGCTVGDHRGADACAHDRRDPELPRDDRRGGSAARRHRTRVHRAWGTPSTRPVR